MKLLFFGRTIDVLRLFGIVLVVVLLIATFNNITSYLSIKQELGQWKKNYQVESAKNKKLKSELIFASDPAFLEEKIRNELGRQRAGEEIFVIDAPTIKSTPAPTPKEGGWVQKILPWR